VRSETLLTRVNCCLCDEAKEVLERLRADYNLEVTTVNIDSAEGQAIAISVGALFPPAVLVDGQAFSVGSRPSEGELRQQLDGDAMTATGRLTRRR